MPIPEQQPAPQLRYLSIINERYNDEMGRIENNRSDACDKGLATCCNETTYYCSFFAIKAGVYEPTIPNTRAAPILQRMEF